MREIKQAMMEVREASRRGGCADERAPSSPLPAPESPRVDGVPTW